MVYLCEGTLKLEERELNPRDIVKHVVRTAIAASKDRGIIIQADIGDDVPSVVHLQRRFLSEWFILCYFGFVLPCKSFILSFLIIVLLTVLLSM